MQQGTQRHSIIPRTTEIRDIDVGVADRLVLAPFQQGISFWTTIFYQRLQRVFSFTCIKFKILVNIQNNVANCKKGLIKRSNFSIHFTG